VIPVLWTSADAEAATGGRGNRPWLARGISIDTRTLAHDDLFIAIKGETHDGHDHLEAAFSAGASAAMIDHIPHGASLDSRALLMVRDTIEAVTRLGAAARARAPDVRAVAVTGSVGKTSTKDALRHVLAAQAPTHGAAASFNNHIGVPVTLARLPPSSRFAVYEIGMNHANEIAPLVHLVRPQVAVITMIAAAHTENFPDGIDGVARAKAEIFEAGGEAAIINRDSVYFERLAARARARGFTRIIGFGGDDAADIRLVDLEPAPTHSMVTASIDGRPLTYRVGAPGRHWAINSLAVLGAVGALGAHVGAAAEALATMSAVKGRGMQITIGEGDRRFTLIDDSYNANPTSMRAALDVLRQIDPAPGGRRVAVLGDMLELGPDAARLHAELADAVISAEVDLVFTCGPLMAVLAQSLPATRRGVHAPSSEQLVAQVVAAIQGGDVVVVKGSLGSRMAPIVAALQARDGTRQAAG